MTRVISRGSLGLYTAHFAVYKYVFILTLLFLPLISVVGQTPELVIQRGHNGQINDFSVTPDGNFLVTGSDDCSLKVWDIKTGKEVRTLNAFSQPVERLVISHDGSLVACGSNKKEQSLKVFRLGDGSLVTQVSGITGAVNDIRFSRDDSRLLVVVEEEGFVSRVMVINWRSNLVETTLQLSSKEFVKSACFGPKEATVITGGKRLTNEGTENISVWELPKGKRDYSLKKTATDVNQVVYDEQNNLLYSGGNRMDVWNPESKELVRTLPGNSAFFSLNSDFNQLLVCRGRDVFFRDPATGSETGILKGAHVGMTVAARFLPGNQYVLTIGKDRDVKLWNADALIQVPMFSRAPIDEIKNFTLGEKGKVAWFLSDDGAVIQLDMRDGKFTGLFRDEEGKPRFKAASMAWNESLRELVVVPEASRDLHFYNVKFKKYRHHRVHTSYLSAVEVDPSGKLVAVSAKDNSIILFRLADSSRAAQLKGHRNGIPALAFSRDGSVLYSGSSDKTVKAWDVARASLMVSLDVSLPVNSIALSTDGQWLASAGGDRTNVKAGTGELLLWKAAQLSAYTSGIEKPIVLTGHQKPVLHVDFSNDGQKLVSSAADNQAIEWDATQHQMLNTFRSHTRAVTCSRFLDSDRLLITASADGFAMLHDASGGTTQLTWMTFQAGKDHVVFTPENYYTCTRDGIRNLHFLMNSKVFLFEQFDLRLNRPDKAVAVLPYANAKLLGVYREAYRKRLKKMGFTEEQLTGDFHIPEVAIENEDEIPYNSLQKEIVLKISAFDDVDRLSRLNLWVNDVPVYGMKGMDLTGQDDRQVGLSLSVVLSDGLNKIQVSVINEKGGESLKATKFVYFKPPDGKLDKLFVVTIGVSQFLEKTNNLDYAAKDAADIAALFKNKEKTFSAVSVLNISNQKATKENILAASSFLSACNEDDYVVVFMASHGLLDQNLQYYLATFDTDFRNPARKGLPYEELELLLDGIKSRKKILLIDACHSGEVDKDEMGSASAPITDVVSTAPADVKGAKIKSRGFKAAGTYSIGIGSSFEVMKEMFADLRRGTGATVISSAGGQEFALESSQWNNGVFTYSILEGVETGKADLNNDGHITVSELKEYTSRQVQKLTGGKQNPTSRTENLEFNYNLF